jgi:hypothetical protein
VGVPTDAASAVRTRPSAPDGRGRSTLSALERHRQRCSGKLPSLPRSTGGSASSTSTGTSTRPFAPWTSWPPWSTPATWEGDHARRDAHVTLPELSSLTASPPTRRPAARDDAALSADLDRGRKTGRSWLWNLVEALAYAGATYDPTAALAARRLARLHDEGLRRVR